MATKRALIDLQNDGGGRTKVKLQCTGFDEIPKFGIDEPLCKELSPSRVARVAKLKARFAGIILKSQKELRQCGEKGYATNKKQEKKDSTFEEKRMIKMRLKAAENVAKKAELRRSMQIKKEREAFRIALEKMEGSVEFNDFNHLAKDMMELGCQDLSLYVLGQIGLFLKDEDCDLHQVDQLPALSDEDLEEGEIHV